MTILLDLHQVVISTLMTQIHSNREKFVIDENLIRHMILNTIRSYKVKFGSKYGEMVIACDSNVYWRKEYFPYYKANRKKTRDEGPLDWKLIYRSLDKIRSEISQFLPYKLIIIEGAEADDIIGTLAPRITATGSSVLILSSDNDFVQLQQFPRIEQYSPILRKFLKSDNPKNDLREHIIRGDKSDGIPNFLSRDDTFVTGDRQTTINSKKLADWLSKPPKEFCISESMSRGYARNQKLIDLSYIPAEIQSAIIAEYEREKPKVTKNDTLNYFINKGLKNLIEHLGEF